LHHLEQRCSNRCIRQAWRCLAWSRPHFATTDARRPPLRARVNWKLQSITKQDSGDYALVYETPEGAQTITARQVALTVPAYTAADLLKKHCVSIPLRCLLCLPSLPLLPLPCGVVPMSALAGWLG
jgi:hypothetical protein